MRGNYALLTPSRPLLCLTLLLAWAGSHPLAAQPLPDPAAWMARANVPGLSLAVIREGHVVRVESLGAADAETGAPVTTDTLFEAASLSKPVFATIVLAWAARGDLDLDRPLAELLPYPRIAHDPRAAKLTARLVLSHQTGLPNWGGEKLEFLFDPGVDFNYSGEGYVYLQRVLEHLSGESLDALARREVFDPLGMRRSRFSWPEPEADGRPALVARRHSAKGKPAPPPRSTDPNAASSLLTTAEEYARFVIAWMDGELLPAAMMREALTPAVHMQGTETRRPKPPEVYRRIAWGLGWGLLLPQGIAWHWGDNGPAKAFVAFDPVRRNGIVYFANGDRGLAFGAELAEPVVGDVAVTFAWNGYDPL